MHALIDHIGTLPITQGQGAGEPFKVLPWQARFIRGAFAVEGDAALSVARGAGKTTLTAGIAHAALAGPLAQPRAEVLIVASSFAQGGVLFRHVLSWCDRDRFRIWDSGQVANITDRKTGTMLRVLGSDPKRMHGAAPALVLADEPAQWPATIADKAVAALRTSMGKIPGSRMIALGTRPDDAHHWFQALLDGGADYAQSHAAGPKDPPFQARTWHRANPSLRFMPALLARTRKEADEARRDPAMLAAFRALRLNQGVADTLEAVLLTAETWRDAEGDVPATGEYVLGVDMGGAAAMSGAAGYWWTTGRLDAFALFPARPDLRERGLRDGVGALYQDMQRRGELLTSGGRVADHAVLFETVAARWGRPVAVVCDRWRLAELRDAMDETGLLVPVVARGQGYKDGGEDVREFRRAVLAGAVRPVASLVMRAAMAEARVTTDPAGNAKLAIAGEGTRRRKRARDDVCAAGILAVAEGGAAGAASGRELPGLVRRVVGAVERLDRRRWNRTRRRVFDRDGYRCRSCGKAGRLECDHVTPIQHGGDPWDMANLQTLCAPCHIRKTRAEWEADHPERAAWRALVAELAGRA